MRVGSNGYNFINQSNTSNIESEIFALHFPSYSLYAKPSLQFYSKKGNPSNVIIKLIENGTAVLIRYDSTYIAKGNSHFSTYNKIPDILVGDDAVNWFNSLNNSKIFKLNGNPIEVDNSQSLTVDKSKSASSMGESECKRVLEAIFNKPFSPHRPNWLKNPETGNNLQLDFYNEEIKLAVEYDKPSHYEDVDSLNSKLVDVRSRDMFKDKCCHANNVLLIRVPYWLKSEEIENYIKDRIPIRYALDLLMSK